jgi:hypothetical protein
MMLAIVMMHKPRWCKHLPMQSPARDTSAPHVPAWRQLPAEQHGESDTTPLDSNDRILQKSEETRKTGM